MAHDAFGWVRRDSATPVSSTESVWVLPVADVPACRARLLGDLGRPELAFPAENRQIDVRRVEGFTCVLFTSRIFWAWDRREGTNLILVHQGDADERLHPASQSSLTLMLSEHMLSRGWSLCHAGGVDLGGRRVLVAGASGSGKSTVVAALWQAGGRLLSDDLCLINAPGRPVTILGLLEPLHLCRDTRGALAEVVAADAPIMPGRGKVRVDPAAVRPDSIIDRLDPDLLLFPCCDGSDPHLVEPSRDEAFLRLSAACQFLPDHGRHPVVHRAVNAVLDRTHWYRLHTGPRIDRIPEVIRHAPA